VSPVGLGKGTGSTQRLLERDAMLAELRGLTRRLPGGQGRMVLLRGEAGAGKTAVIARWLVPIEPARQEGVPVLGHDPFEPRLGTDGASRAA
jgi:AAA ATPase domain